MLHPVAASISSYSWLLSFEKEVEIFTSFFFEVTRFEAGSTEQIQDFILLKTPFKAFLFLMDAFFCFFIKRIFSFQDIIDCYIYPVIHWK